MDTGKYDYILIKLTAAEKKKFGKFCAKQGQSKSMHLLEYITKCIKSPDDRIFFRTHDGTN